MSADTDFGELLTRHGLAVPSLVLFRQGNRDPEHQATTLLGNLDEVAEDLEAGAIVVFTNESIRIRQLLGDQELRLLSARHLCRVRIRTRIRTLSLRFGAPAAWQTAGHGGAREGPALTRAAEARPATAQASRSPS
ncbi:hypothetical protein GCM10027062_17930 [Nocardioides hungaricus]